MSFLTGYVLAEGQEASQARLEMRAAAVRAQ
jgi:hypothetical protein